MAVVKELDRVLSGKVISGTGGSFHRNLEIATDINRKQIQYPLFKHFGYSLREHHKELY
jgi:hypothetical protein